MNAESLLFSLLNSAPTEPESEPPCIPSAAVVEPLNRQQIAELTIAELTLTIQGLREELVNAYQQIINRDHLQGELDASYGREQCPDEATKG